MNDKKLLSVVITYTNGTTELEECLDSLLETKFPQTNFEVLFLDDGNDENVSAICDAYAPKFATFKRMVVATNDLSELRSTGLHAATGQYVVFMDSRDQINPMSYTNLVQTAIDDDADIVVGYVIKFDADGNKDDYENQLGTQDNLKHATLEDNPGLLYDNLINNKLYRREFLADSSIQFTQGVIDEDMSFALAAHLASKSTSVITDISYLWRAREIHDYNGPDRQEFSDFNARTANLNICRTILAENGYVEGSPLYLAFIHKVLNDDLPSFFVNVADTTEYFQYHIQELVYRFLRDWNLWDSPAIKLVDLKTQLQYWAIAHGDLGLLKQYSYNKKLYEISERFGRNYKLSIPGTDQKIVDQLDASDNVLPVVQQISRVKLDNDTGLVEGKGYFRIKNMPLSKRPFSNNNVNETISAQLVNIVNHAVYPIDFKRATTPLNKRIFKSHSAWTHARYEFSFDLADATKQLGQGTWKILVTNEVANKYKVSAYLDHPGPKATKFKLKFLQKGNVVVGGFNRAKALSFTCKTKEALSGLWLKNAQAVAEKLVFDTNLDATKEVGIIMLKANSSQEMKPIIGQITAGKISFDLAGVPIDLLGESLVLNVQNLSTGFQRPYQYEYQKIADVFNFQDRMINVNYSSTKQLLVTVNYPAFTAVKDKFDGKKLKETIQLLQPVGQYDLSRSKLVLSSRNHKERVIFNLDDIVGKLEPDSNKLKIKLPLQNAEGRLQILAGIYSYTLEMFDNDLQKVAIYSVVDKKYIDPVKAVDNPKTSTTLTLNHGQQALVNLRSSKQNAHELRIRQPFSGWINAKKGRRAVNYTLLYPLMRLLPLRKNVMVFQHDWGSNYGGNEAAMYEYIRQHHSEIKPIWFMKNDQVEVPADGEVVRINTLKYWYYLAVGKYFVQNTNLTNQYYKRKGQIEVETLRNSFLREMGFDSPRYRTAGAKVQLELADRIRRWDYMVVPSDYMAVVASKAYDYDRIVLRTGFPKVDQLIHEMHDENRMVALKKQMHLPLDKKVVLYAPTKRDKNSRELGLDLDILKDQLNDEFVIVLSLDSQLAHSVDVSRYAGLVYDLSDYGSQNDLMLISDVMVTDYSNRMFEYAYLKRPMIFFAYDQVEVLEENPRDTYFDYTAQMPGPIVQTTAQVATALLHLPEITAEYATKMTDFYNQYAEYGRQGDATKQVVETLLATNVKELDQEPPKAVIWNKFWHFFKIKDLQARLLNWLGEILPKKDIIIFESFFGRQFSDNPKALYEYIKSNYPQYKLYWNIRDDMIPYFKEHKIPYTVRYGYKGITKQAQAKYYITNTRRPFRWNKPKGTTLLETWHGTPLKTIGTDVQLVTMPVNDSGKYHEGVVRDSKRWDYLIAPNKYSADIMSRAFRKDNNQMMLTGYPRNDILINYTDDDIKRIKDELNLDPTKKLVLYAPTWRDDEFVKAHEFTAQLRLDLAELEDRFGDNVIFLIRTHYMIANSLDLTKFTNAVNVSDYQDISELYLISDVLVTDYSSVMFDYSILRRPIIFYTYDLEQYASTIRGFYFDFTQAAPGKLVKTTTAVADELEDIFTNGWTPDQQYLDFTQRFDEWMDGHASERVVKELFDDDNMKVVPVKGDLSSIGIASDEPVNLRDGAAIWAPNKNFTDNNDLSFIKYYDKTDKPAPIEAVEAQLIKSTHTDVLMNTYVKVKVPDSPNTIVGWVSLDDILS